MASDLQQGAGRDKAGQSISFCAGSILGSQCAGSLHELGQDQALSCALPCWEKPGTEEVLEARFVRRGNIFYGSNSQRWIKGTGFRAPRSFFVSEIGAARDEPGN